MPEAAPAGQDGPTGAQVPTRTLILGLVRADRTLHAAEAYDLADTVGMTDLQVRLCLRRLVTEGVLASDGRRGRAAHYRHLGPPDTDAIPEIAFIRHAEAQDAGTAPWDRHWYLAAVTVPESRRAARDAMREHLRYLGGAPFGNGTAVSPHDWRADVTAQAQRLGIADTVRLARCDDLDIGGQRDPAAVAARLWDLAPVAAAYHTFLRENGDLSTAADSTAGISALGTVLRTTVAFARAAANDPMLPPELLPQTWPGPAARRILATLDPAVARARAADNPDNPLLLLDPTTWRGPGL